VQIYCVYITLEAGVFLGMFGLVSVGMKMLLYSVHASICKHEDVA
jgi:hypothetical protein